MYVLAYNPVPLPVSNSVPACRNGARRAQAHYGRFGTRRAEKEGLERGCKPEAVPSPPSAPPTTCLTTATAFRPRVPSRGSARPVSQFRTVSLLTPIALARSTCLHPRSRRYCRSRSAKVRPGNRGIQRNNSTGSRLFLVCVEYWTARAGSLLGGQPKKSHHSASHAFRKINHPVGLIVVLPDYLGCTVVGFLHKPNVSAGSDHRASEVGAPTLTPLLKGAGHSIVFALYLIRRTIGLHEFPSRSACIICTDPASTSRFTIMSRVE